METESNVPDRVKRGVELLDRERPEWWKEIDLDRLSMSSTCNCVLGQEYGSFIFATTELIEHTEGHEDRFGFDSKAERGSYADDFHELTEEWRRVVLERRAALLSVS